MDDGRFDNQELVNLLNNDERKEAAKTRIAKTDVLVIDEVCHNTISVSMIIK